MNSKDWQAIEQARELLVLGDKATLAEIKRAYYRQSKIHHPDTSDGGGKDGSDAMYKITAAYELLLRYCNEFRFPLSRPDDQQEEYDLYDPEEWWQARFGQDPICSGNRGKKR